MKFYFELSIDLLKKGDLLVQKIVLKRLVHKNFNQIVFFR